MVAPTAAPAAPTAELAPMVALMVVAAPAALAAPTAELAPVAAPTPVAMADLVPAVVPTAAVPELAAIVAMVAPPVAPMAAMVVRAAAPMAVTAGATPAAETVHRAVAAMQVPAPGEMMEAPVVAGSAAPPVVLAARWAALAARSEEIEKTVCLMSGRTDDSFGQSVQSETANAARDL
jgi:hypothetical protein